MIYLFSSKGIYETHFFYNLQDREFYECYVNKTNAQEYSKLLIKDGRYIGIEIVEVEVNHNYDYVIEFKEHYSGTELIRDLKLKAEEKIFEISINKLL
jgi:hypothetical protein